MAENGTQGIDRRGVLLLAGAAVLTMGMGSKPKMAVLKGTVFYRERMALPPGAVVKVQLVDVSRADAAAKVIAEVSVPAGPGTPTAFEIEYQAALIEPKMSYALQARIVDGETLLFVSTKRYPVLRGGSDVTDILVQRTGGEAAASPVGRWLAEDIMGGGVIDDAQSTLEIAADGMVSGRGGCNGFGGTATIDGEKIAFGQMRSTMMACAPALMDQEGKFHAALGAARSFAVDGGTRKLTLKGADGAAVMVLGAM